MALNKTLQCLALAGLLAAGSAWAKLPPPSDEQKAKAAEAKAKAADAAKKEGEDLAKAQDRVQQRYIQQQKAKGITVKPTPITPPPTVAAAPGTPPAPIPGAKPTTAPGAAAAPAAAAPTAPAKK